MYAPSNEWNRSAVARLLHAGAVEQVGEAHALPLDLGHPPAGDALEVARQLGRRHRDELVVGERERLVDEAVDLQPVVGPAPRRQAAGDGVDPEPADREQRRQPGPVLGDERADLAFEPVLDAGAEQHARGADAEQARNTRRPTGVPVASGAGLGVGSSATPPRVRSRRPFGSSATDRTVISVAPVVIRAAGRLEGRRDRSQDVRRGHGMATSTTSLGIPGLRGRPPHPGDGGYDEARAVFNGMIDRRPAMIAVCGTTDDVVAAVNFAREQGLPISVYGGGHGVTGAAVVDEGLVVDLRGMKGIEVDPGGADGARRGRAQLGRVRRRHPGARARGHRWPGARHRHRRPRARERQRLARAQVRLHVRQPDRGRGRHRRRPRGQRVGGREPGAVLGAARRWRQLRRRHRVPPPAAPDRPDRARRAPRVAGADGG